MRLLTKVQLARVVRSLREGHGWSQAELAKKADLPQSSICQYETALAMPSRRSRRALAKALEVDELQLVVSVEDSKAVEG